MDLMEHSQLAKHCEISMNFDSRLRWIRFKVRKPVSRSARSQSCLCPFNEEMRTGNEFNEITMYIVPFRVKKGKYILKQLEHAFG